MNARDKAALRALFAKRTPTEVAALAALVRKYDDKTLRAALARRRKPAQRRDPLLRDVAEALKPVLAPAAEKADMLAEHLAQQHGRKLTFAPRGLADGVRRLRRHFSDAQIRAGAKSLAADLARAHGGRDGVV